MRQYGGRLIRMHPVAGVGDGVDLCLGIQPIDGFEVRRSHVVGAVTGQEAGRAGVGVRCVLGRVRPHHG